MNGCFRQLIGPILVLILIQTGTQVELNSLSTEWIMEWIMRFHMRSHCRIKRQHNLKKNHLCEYKVFPAWFWRKKYSVKQSETRSWGNEKLQKSNAYSSWFYFELQCFYLGKEKHTAYEGLPRWLYFQKYFDEVRVGKFAYRKSISKSGIFKLIFACIFLNCYCWKHSVNDLQYCELFHKTQKTKSV